MQRLSKAWKRRAAWVLVFLCGLLLASCAKSGFAEEAKIAERYRGETSFSANLSVTLDHGNHTTSYRMTHTYKHGEGHVMTVEEPATLSGLVIRAGEDDMSLEYQGMIFTPQDMVGTSATPVKLLPALYRAWGMGISENVSFEKTENGRLIVLDIFSKVDGDEFLLRTWFDESTLHPTKAECFFDGRRVMTCEYADVAVE